MLNERDQRTLLEIEDRLCDSDERLARSFDILGQVDRPDGPPARLEPTPGDAAAPRPPGVAAGVLLLLGPATVLVLLGWALLGGHGPTAVVAAVSCGPLVLMLCLIVLMLRR